MHVHRAQRIRASPGLCIQLIDYQTRARPPHALYFHRIFPARGSSFFFSYITRNLVKPVGAHSSSARCRCISFVAPYHAVTLHVSYPNCLLLVCFSLSLSRSLSLSLSVSLSFSLALYRAASGAHVLPPSRAACDASAHERMVPQLARACKVDFLLFREGFIIIRVARNKFSRHAGSCKEQR